MSLASVTRGKRGERIRVTYTPDAPDPPGTVDVFIDLDRTTNEQKVIRELPTVPEPRGRALGRSNHPFANVFSDLNTGQQTSFRAQLRIDLNGIFGVNIPPGGLAEDEFEVYVDQIDATWTGTVTPATSIKALLDTRETVLRLFTAGATEAQELFRYNYGRWESLTAGEQAEIENLIDRLAGAFFADVPA